MPRPGKRVAEKSKDFKGSMKRLLSNLRPWKVLMFLALILAMLSAILSLISPNKLSDFADEISLGLKPRIENLEIVAKEMSKNISDEELMMTGLENREMALFLLPRDTLKVILDDIEVENEKIDVYDQLDTNDVLNKMNKNNGDSNEALKLIDELPESVYNVVGPKMNVKKIKKIAIFLGILFLLSSLFSYIQSLSMTTVSNKYAYSLRKSVSSKINKLPLKYFDNHETGDVLSRITNDIDTIAQNLNNSLSSLVSNITLFIGSIIMMFYTNYVMAITAILSSLIGFMFMGKILGRSQKYFAESQRALGELNGYIEEMYTGHNVLRAYNATNTSIKEFEKLNNKLNVAKRKSIFLSGTMQPMMGFVGNLGYVAVCIVGALLAMNNHISFGVIVAFMVYVRLFTNPLSQMAQAMTNLQSTAAAAERVFEFIDEVEMSSEKVYTKKLNKDEVKGKIEFKNVKFGYDDNKIIIKDFSAIAKPGEKIAIVGPTGAGKTTMVNLLMKFYEINDGDILIDGVSTKDLTRENVHDLFIMVLQDTWLFDGTIRENIKYNKKDVTDDEIWSALKTVGIDHFVKTLPGGLNAKITDNDSISQGQKQLLTIARGMIEDAPFLILDEATSNVDTRTEELVQKAMDKLTKGRTSFIIAHRLSTIKNADMILVMKDGNIIETGNHDELIKQNGFYADLYNSQFKK